MPQYASWVLQDPNKDGYIRALIFNDGPFLTILRIIKLSQVVKSRETPVALLGDETMMCVYGKEVKYVAMVE